MKFLDQLMEQLPIVGIDVETVQSEYGPGQQEITYKPSFGIQAAHIAHTYKASIKEIALHHGYMAVFMSKPWADECGSSAHFNHSLWDAEGKIPMLYDANDRDGLSEIAQHWIAGILHHAPATTLIEAPTVNCLSRLRNAANFVPKNNTWGMDNRNCFLRVKVNGPRCTYFENRAGASGSNPYLTLAATVAAGIDGIQRKMTFPNALNSCMCDSHAYKPGKCDKHVIPEGIVPIPTTMKDALKAFLDDKVICEALGEDFVALFTAHKFHELNLEAEAQDKGDKEWERKLFFKYL